MKSWAPISPKFRPTLNETKRIVAHDTPIHSNHFEYSERLHHTVTRPSNRRGKETRDESDSIRFVNDRPMPPIKL